MLFELLMKLMLLKMLLLLRKSELRYLQNLHLAVMKLHQLEPVMRLFVLLKHLVEQLKLHFVQLKLLVVKLLQNLQKTVHSN